MPLLDLIRNRHRKLSEAQQRDVAAAWESIQPLVHYLEGLYPDLDVAGWAALLLCRHLPSYDPSRPGATTLEKWAAGLVSCSPDHARRERRPAGFKGRARRAPSTYNLFHFWGDVEMRRYLAVECDEPGTLESAWSLLSCLPKRDAKIVWMHHVDGLSYKEIAAELGTRSAEVKSRLQIGRAHV